MCLCGGVYANGYNYIIFASIYEFNYYFFYFVALFISIHREESNITPNYLLRAPYYSETTPAGRST